MLRLLTLSLAAALLPGAATAQAIIAQLAGLQSPQQVVNFGANLFPNFTIVTTQFPGITLTHARYYTTSTLNNLSGGFLTNDFAGGPPNTLRIQFAQPVRDVSFVYHQIGISGPSTIRAVLQGNPVTSFSGFWNASQPNNFFGFTNTVFDELQIDFVNDFNLDTLAFNFANGALCHFHNGSGVNPQGFTCQTRPIFGTTWQGAIAHSASTLVSGLVFGPGGIGAPLPLFGGELLLSLTPGPLLVTGGPAYSLAIPSGPTWVGVTVPFQGLRLDLVGGTPTIVLLNAMELRLGP